MKMGTGIRIDASERLRVKNESDSTDKGLGFPVASRKEHEQKTLFFQHIYLVLL